MMSLQKMNNKELLGELAQILAEKEEYQAQVEQLNQKLKEVNKRLSESEALKSHFISNISNELVNPFTSVLALTENILSVEKENWKKVISMVSLIHKEVFNLDFQLKNIFAAAKLEAGETVPEVTLINVDNLVENIISAFKYEARRQHVQIQYVSDNETVNSTIFFKSDVEKIHLTLSNLLSNAIKFSYPDSKIIIRAKKNEKSLTLSVQDFGQGISKANEQIIFDRFRRLDDGINSINRGHGLGLSIIKANIDLLEGKIHFKSELGKGTTFTIILNESEQETTGVSTDVDELFFKQEKF